MGNVLSDDKRQQVLALGRLGWSLRRIEEATEVRRETASGYLRAAGLEVRGRGRPPGCRSKPATREGVSTDPEAPKPAISVEVSTDSSRPKPATSEEVSTDSGRVGAVVQPGRAPSASACEPFREVVVDAVARGRNAMAICQDLVDDHGFRGRYASVRRFVVNLRGQVPLEARVVITTAPGEDYVQRGVMLSTPRAAPGWGDLSSVA